MGNVDTIQANCDPKPLIELNRAIRKIPFVEGLEAIRKIAFTKDRTLGGRGYPWVTLFGTKNRETQLKDIHQFELDYMAKALLLFGDPNRSAQPSYQTFRSLVNVIKGVSLPYFSQGDVATIDGWPLVKAQTFATSIILMQTIWQQRFFQTNWALRFYRYQRMFGSQLPVGKTSVAEFIAREFGVDWSTLSKFALATMIISQSNYSPLDLDWYAASQYSKTTFLNQHVAAAILDRLSWASVAEFRHDYQQSPFRDDDKMLYDYNPLWTRPFVRHKRGWLLPIPSYLIRAITEALVYELRNALGGQFGNVFGTKVFQEYVHDVLARRTDVQVVDMDSVLGLGNHKRCDFLVTDGQGVNLYVECKASTPTLSSRLGRYEDVVNEAKRIAAALEQCVLTQQMVNDGGVAQARPQPVEFFLVVAMDEHYLFDVDAFLRSLVEMELLAKGIKLATEYRVVGIETLETLMDLTPPQSFVPNITAAYATHSPIVFELSHLNLLPPTKSVAFQHVASQLNEISRELFGQDLSSWPT
jgi:hypothetical protein